MAHPSIPKRYFDLPLLSYGVSGLVRIVDDHIVVKHTPVLNNERYDSDLATEHKIYQRLGSHPRIVAVLAYVPGHYIALERHVCCLREHLYHRQKLDPASAPPQIQIQAQALRWAVQAAEALQFMHEKGVFQVDVGAHNILLDKRNDLKFCDFAGSSIDGSSCTVAPGASASKPDKDFEPSVETELFALGSFLYEMETGFVPYHDKQTIDEIEELFGADVFPDTQGLVLGEVIQKCWRGQFGSASEALADIKRVQEEFELRNKVLEKDDSRLVHRPLDSFNLPAFC